MMHRENWPESQLGKHAYIKGRIGWRGLKASEYTNDGPFLIAGNHLNNGRVNWTVCDHITKYRYDESWEIALKKDDIILTKDGTIGRVAIVDYLPGPATINSTMMLVRVYPPLHSKYVYHYLNSVTFQKLVEEKVSGSSIPHIFQRDMVKLKLTIPPEIEQRRIAEILDTIDEAIQKTEALISKLKAMKQGLLYDLLTRGLDKNGKLRDPKAHPEQFKDSPLGRIPNEWDVINLGDSFEELYRYPTYYGIMYVNYGVPEVRGELIKKDGTMEENTAAYRYINRETADRFPRVHLEPGDFVMSVRGTMGKIAIVPERLRGAVITANLIRMKFAKSVIVSKWAHHFLRSAFFQDALDLATSATTIKTIQVSQLCSIPFRRPLVDEQIRIADILDAHDTRIRTEEQYRDKLKLQKKGLMHDLLTGRVRIEM